MTNNLQMRLARAEDFSQVEAIAAQIWEGNDYIPRVWEKWLNDPEGAFVIAELSGCVVGFAKLTRQGADEWWFEGLRVDPAFRRQGISRALGQDVLARFRALGGGLGRFATASNNAAVHKTAKEDGFVKAAAFAIYEAPSRSSDADAFRLLAPVDAPRAWAYLDTSAYFEANLRSYAKGWVWYTLTEERLHEELEAGRVYAWFGGQRAAAEVPGGIVIINAPDEDHEDNSRIRVAYLDARDSGLAAAAQGFRAVAGAMGISKVQIKTLVHPERLAALEQAGYQRTWEHEVWLYVRDERSRSNQTEQTEGKGD